MEGNTNKKSSLPDNVLTVNNLSVKYKNITAVNDVSLHCMAGEITAIIGNNGCGKTSLIRAILNLIPHTGECCINTDGNNSRLDKMSVKKTASLISYIPQNYGVNISMTVLDVCMLGFNSRLSVLEHPTKEMKNKAIDALISVGLADYTDRDFMTLSEGQKQLCILARTIIEETSLLLLDEPDSSLDFENRHKLMKKIRTLVSADKAAIINIHSPELALRYCDNIFLMKDGHFVESICVSDCSVDDISGKLSMIYDNIDVVECIDKNGNRQKCVLSL